MKEFYKVAKQIDNLISKKLSKDSIEKLLHIIESNKAYEFYFFKNIEIVDLFYPLKNNGYLSPDKALAPELVEQRDSFIIPQWNVLPYLEKISQQVTIAGNEKYSSELLEIIKNVTEYHIEEDRKLDNYRTWWYFVKILLNIPNDKIALYLKDNSIQIGKDWIREWITSRFDSSLPASDVATKLLPKFLTENKEDIDIVEQIIDAITDIKEDFFEDEEAIRGIVSFKKKEPKTKVDSHWLIESFKKNDQKIGKLCSEEVIYKLAEKLKNILNKEHKDHQVLLAEDKYRIYARRKEDFNFEIKIEVLNEDELKKLSQKDRYFGVLKVPGEILYTFPLSNIRNKKDFAQTLRDEIKRNDKMSFLNSFEELTKKINNLYEGLYSDYSSIWYKSLSRGPDIGIHNAQELLIFILRDILLSKCVNDITVGETILKKFLGDEYQYPIFRRLAIYVIGNCWNDRYKKLFWDFVDKNSYIFQGTDYEVELYKLLKENVIRFDESSEKPKLKAVIEAGPKDLRYAEDEKDKKEKYIAHWKQKWYSALQKDEYFLKPFEGLKKITKDDKIVPPSEEAISTWVGPGDSPIAKEKILEMKNLEIAKYLNEFKAKDRWEGPTKEGLAEVLRSAVKEKTEKFVNELDQFLTVNYLYVYNILYGLEDAWKEKKGFDWGKLFAFIKEYLNKADFLAEAKRVQGEDFPKDPHIWIINVTADLIQEGTRDDSWAFEEKYLLQAEEIIDIILEILKKLPKNEKITHKDFMTEALNTSYGRVIMAIILLSLRTARLKAKKEEKIEWNPTGFDELFEEGVVEAFTLFGRSMPNFAYLNKPWVEKKIKEFERFDNGDVKWQSFMEGYLFGHRVYQDLYGLMRNHYTIAIDNDFEKDQIENRLVQHITIGFLRGNESLEGKDSLFRKIIDKWQYSQINEIVGFFWSQARHLKEGAKQKSEEDKEFKERIIEFWRWTYNKRAMIKDKLKNDYENLLSELARLAVLFDKIDTEKAKWILLSAPYVEIGFDSSFFIEYLNIFEDKKSLSFIGKIFLETLSKSTPNFKKEDIISIVSKLYHFKFKNEADKICNIYGSKGLEFLRPVYEVHNK